LSISGKTTTKRTGELVKKPQTEKRTKVLIAILAVQLMISAGAEAKEKVVPVTVAVTVAKSESGFVLGKDVEDSAKDVSKHIKGDWLKLVDDAGSATIDIRVTSRERRASGHNSTLGDKKTTLTRYTVNTELYVRGELVRTLEGIDESEFSTWGGAARERQETT
jgi:hypothetical protein